MSVAETIKDLKTGTYTVTRRTSATAVKGRAVAPTTSTISIEASVQPLGGRELMRLPEGERTQEKRVVFSTVELRTQSSVGPADSISIDGQDWEISSVENWMTLGGFFKAIATKVQR